MKKFTAIHPKTEVAEYERSNARPQRGQYHRVVKTTNLQPLTRTAARCCRAR